MERWHGCLAMVEPYGDAAALGAPAVCARESSGEGENESESEEWAAWLLYYRSPHGHGGGPTPASGDQVLCSIGHPQRVIEAIRAPIERLTA